MDVEFKETKKSNRNRIKPMETTSLSCCRYSSFFPARRRKDFDREEGKKMRTRVILFLLAVVGCALKGSLAHRNHVVGSRLGWTLPPNKTFYQDWAQKRHFAVGERLVFPFRVGLQNVVEVSKEDFDNCTEFKVIERYHDGPLVLELTKPGPHYYYCAIGLHCESGQKLAINVSAKAPAGISPHGRAPAPRA